MKYVLGIDIGTQGTKAALFDREGACLAEGFHSSNLIKPKPGVVEEVAEDQVSAVCAAVRQCMDGSGVSADEIAALGIDGQMAGIIGIGADGRAVTPYDSWLDTRCAKWIEVMKDEAEDEIIEKTGGPPSFNHGPKILWWKHERPEVFEKIVSFVQPGSYAAMRLCGLGAEEAFIDPSYLHFSGFADNRKKTWDGELCRRFDLDPAKLPRIVESHEIVGEVTAETAGRLGIAEGTPVVAGCGDTAASFLACGATEEGICVDVAGTASVFASTTSDMIIDYSKVLGCGHSATPGLWHPYAYINGGGMNLEWFKEEIADPKKSGAVTFDDLTASAEELNPEKSDPLFIPHFGGRVCPSMPRIRGGWVGINWGHTMAHMYRAIYEGTALEYGIYMNTLTKVAPEFSPKEMRISGGGAKSDLWNRMKADILGIPAVLLSRPEGAPLGSAILAGFGAGLFADTKRTADEWIRKSGRIEPDTSKRSLYRERIAMYSDFIEAINTIHEKYSKEDR
jgi:xylulokinase